MPGGDRTGPLGMGPMTGRAAGYCAGYPVPGYMNPYGGRGYLGGRGGGRGFRGGSGYYSAFPPYGNPMYAPYNPVAAPVSQYGVPGAAGYDRSQELEMLKNQADYLATTLEEIQKRMAELEAGAPEEKKSK